MQFFRNIKTAYKARLPCLSRATKKAAIAALGDRLVGRQY